MFLLKSIMNSRVFTLQVYQKRDEFGRRSFASSEKRCWDGHTTVVESFSFRSTGVTFSFYEEVGNVTAPARLPVFLVFSFPFQTRFPFNLFKPKNVFWDCGSRGHYVVSKSLGLRMIKEPRGETYFQEKGRPGK